MRPTANSIDATSDRDFAIEFVNALSLLALASKPLGRRDDFVFHAGVWLRAFARAYSTGSSAMPQKKNPDLLELVRGKAARVMGCQPRCKSR